MAKFPLYPILYPVHEKFRPKLAIWGHFRKSREEEISLCFQVVPRLSNFADKIYSLPPLATWVTYHVKIEDLTKPKNLIVLKFNPSIVSRTRKKQVRGPNGMCQNHENSTILVAEPDQKSDAIAAAYALWNGMNRGSISKIHLLLKI